MENRTKNMADQVRFQSWAETVYLRLRFLRQMRLRKQLGMLSYSSMISHQLLYPEHRTWVTLDALETHKIS